MRLGVKAMEAKEYLENYYSNYDEDGRLRSKHGFVEFHTTMRYIQKYLKPGDKVLEIGAGTGRYSHALARMGHPVDAVELVEHNIEVFRQNTQPEEQVTVTQGNALDLNAFPDDTYDITLLLGPMYHLFSEEDALQALREAIRVTKPGGVIFVAYCMSDPSIVDYGFQKGNIHSLLDEGFLDPVNFKTKSTLDKHLFQLYRKAQVDALRGHFFSYHANAKPIPRPPEKQ